MSWPIAKKIEAKKLVVVAKTVTIAQKKNLLPSTKVWSLLMRLRSPRFLQTIC